MADYGKAAFDVSLKNNDKINSLSKGTINVFDSKYSVKGDGSDDTQAIQNAMNDANGKIIKFPKPPNYYKITNRILIPSDVTIIIEGYSKIKFEGSVANNVFYGTEVDNFALIGGIIDGGNAGNTLTQNVGTKSRGAGVFILNSTRKGRVYVSETVFQNTYTAGASFVGFKSCKLIDTDVSNAGEGHIFTVYAGESFVVKNVENVVITGLNATDCTDGLGILLCDKVVINGFTFERCSIGVSPSTCKSVSITNGVIKNPVSRGIDCVSWVNLDAELTYGADYLYIDNVNIECGPVVYNGTTYIADGIAVDSTKYAKVKAIVTGAKKGFITNRNYLGGTVLPRKSGTFEIDVIVQECTQDGIFVSSVDVVKLKGSSINNGKEQVSTYSGVKLVADNAESSMVHVEVDITSIDTQTTKTQKHGLDASGLALSNIARLIVKGTYRGNTVSPLNINYAFEGNLSINSINTDGTELPIQWEKGKRSASVDPNNDRFLVSTGDLQVVQANKGVLLKASDNSVWRLTVSTTGTPVFTKIS